MQFFALLDKFAFFSGLPLGKHLRIKHLSGTEFCINGRRVFWNGHAFVFGLKISHALGMANFAPTFGASIRFHIGLFCNTFGLCLGLPLRFNLF